MERTKFLNSSSNLLSALAFVCMKEDKNEKDDEKKKENGGTARLKKDYELKELRDTALYRLISFFFSRFVNLVFTVYADDGVRW